MLKKDYERFADLIGLLAISMFETLYLHQPINFVQSKSTQFQYVWVKTPDC